MMIKICYDLKKSAFFLRAPLRLSALVAKNSYFFKECFLINSLASIPDSFKSSFFQFPSDDALFCNTEHVSSLSETDHVIQLILFCSAHEIHFSHSSLFIGPSPLA